MRLASLRIVALTLALVLIPTRHAPAASTVRHQLDAVLPEVKFDGVALGDAVDFLRDVSGANITVNWKALEADGVSKDTVINLKLRSISLRRALGLILGDASGGNGKLGFTIDDNVIEISTQQLIDSIMLTRVYPIDDLIMDIPDFTDAPSFDLTANNSNASGGSGGGGNNLFGSNSGGTTQAEHSKTRTERANDLIELIRNIVQPDVWQENGGKAVIRYWNGNLVVTAPRSVQEAIGGQFD